MHRPIIRRKMTTNKEEKKRKREVVEQRKDESKGMHARVPRLGCIIAHTGSLHFKNVHHAHTHTHEEITYPSKRCHSTWCRRFGLCSAVFAASSIQNRFSMASEAYSSVPTPHSSTTTETATTTPSSQSNDVSSSSTATGTHRAPPPVAPALNLPADMGAKAQAFNAMTQPSQDMSFPVAEDPKVHEVDPESGFTKSEKTRFELEGMMGMHRRCVASSCQDG